jgi:hypothetical protein
MRTLEKAILLAVLAQLVAMTAVSTGARASGPASPLDVARLSRQDALAVTARNVSRVAVHAPGQYASEVLSVFKLKIGRFLPESFGIDRDVLRPYLLGGRTELALPVGRTVGEDLPGGGRTTAMHIGGGAEVRLRDHLFLALDVGEVMHSGALDGLSYRTYRLGVLMDF